MEMMSVFSPKRNVVYKRDIATECVEQFSRSRPDDEAFVFVSTDKPRQVVTWRELYSKSIKIAHALLNIGVRKGEIAAICIRACPEWLYMTLGAMYAGVIPINLVFTYKDGSDVVELMKRAEKCALIAVDPGVDNENWNILKHLLDEFDASGKARSDRLPYLRHLVCHDVTGDISDVKALSSWMEEDHQMAALPKIKGDDIAYLFQTSGSTGMPKIVPQTFDSLLAWTAALDYMDTSTGIFYNDRPFAWVGGFCFTIMSGQKRVTISGFSLDTGDRCAFIVETMRKEKCNTASMLPQAVYDLIAHQESKGDNEIVVDTIMTGGQPISASITQSLATTCNRLYIIFGGTEILFCSGLIVTDATNYVDNACGFLFPGLEGKIVDDDGEVVPANTPGELLLKGRSVFRGYYNDSQKTMSSFTADGWFKVGDIALVDDNGLLYVKGRKINEIIRGGISLEILESFIRRCPIVSDAVVVPIPHETLYQEICACVVLKPEAKGTEDDIRKFCEDLHGDQKQMFSYLPKYYLFFDKLPQTLSGKSSRKELENIAKERFCKA